MQAVLPVVMVSQDDMSYELPHDWHVVPDVAPSAVLNVPAGHRVHMSTEFAPVPPL